MRLKEPNTEPALTSAAAHTIEHIAATFLRNHPHFATRTIYFGPMGCLTGFYLLLAGDVESQDIVPLMLELFHHIAVSRGKPGASTVECGNYTLMDLAGAQQEARTFAKEILTGISDAHLFYPE